MADESKAFRLEVIAPDRIFFDDMVEMVELRTTEGDIGVLKGHIPLTAIVAPGIMTVKMAGGEKEAALHDGFIEILKEKVTVLAESCEWPEEIDINRANEAKIRAERRLKGEEGEINEVRAELALRRALTRLDLSARYKK
jgi:F-type H+-transporting ATPase subunit epsilon